MVALRAVAVVVVSQGREGLAATSFELGHETTIKGWGQPNVNGDAVQAVPV